MGKDLKTTSLELLSKIQITISNNIDNEELKNRISNDLTEVIKNIENIDAYSLLSNDPEVLEWNVLGVEELVYTYSLDMDTSAEDELYKLILENIDRVRIGELESLHYQVTENLDKEYVFRDCPEIIDFINKNQCE